MARQSSIRKVLTIRYVSTLILHYLKSNSPLSKKEGNWGKNMSRNGFWDCYWGRVGQLLVNFFPSLVTVPEIFTIVNSSSPVSDQCNILLTVSIENPGERQWELLKLSPRWFFVKFSQPIRYVNVWKSVWWIWIWILDCEKGELLRYLPPGSVLNSASTVKRSTSMSTSLSCSTTRLGFLARTCTLYMWSGSRLVIVCWNVPGRTVL